MTIRNLDRVLAPRSVAVIGASERPGSVGAVVMRNIIDGGFEGPVWPVNPKHDTLHGLACAKRVQDLTDIPDLAVIVTPARSVPGIVASLGKFGCKAACVITAGLTEANGLRQKMLDAAKPHLMRIIGPNTVGLIVPPVKLNASFAHMAPEPGRIALLSQSGAIVTTLIDWASEHGVGFSQVVSLGDMADVDAGDYLDLLGLDVNTRAILVYLESIPQARKFLSAARATSRLKPVIAIKAGRSELAAKAAATHTGALSGADDVVEAALERSGVLRVRGLAEMFAAAETVSRFRPLKRARLGIVTNGGGAGVLAVDRLMEGSGELATLSPETLRKLDRSLPENWSRGNPVDIIGDAPAERYVAALEGVAADRNVDVILVMNCPTALASPSEAAEAVAARVENGLLNRKPVLSCWLGGPNARSAQQILRRSGVASYSTPAAATGAVGHLTDWGRAQAALLHVPDRKVEEALRHTPSGARRRAMEVIGAVAEDRRRILTEPEAKRILAAYGIPVPALELARTPDDVRLAAAGLLQEHGRVVVKLLSRDVSHKSDIGGVVLNVETPRQAEDAARAIAERLAKAQPKARLDGFSVQPMIRRPGSQELIVGVSHDPIFGPVILFGAGGVAVEVLRDTAIGLPPLDASLAGDLIAKTRISQILAGFRDHPAADVAALRGVIVAVSHMIEDLPCLRGVDINPLVADAAGVIALDARIEIDPDDLARTGPNPDLAIRPYPADWRREVALKDGRYTVRPVRPADALLYTAFFEKLDPNDVRLRFMAPMRQLPEEMALRFTQLDYDRDMAFVAIAPDGSLAGVSRLSCTPAHDEAEYALLVRSDLHGRGLGTVLMTQLIDYARSDGIERLQGMVLAENEGMLGLIQRLGFKARLDPEDRGVMNTWLDIAAAQ